MLALRLVVIAGSIGVALAIGATGCAPGGPVEETTVPIQAENIQDLGAMRIEAKPFVDWVTADGDLVWAAGVEPGVVAYAATTGDEVFQVETGKIMLAMETGFGAIWAVEASGAVPDTLVRIDVSTGTVTSRVALPAPGVLTETSVAVTDEAVWVLTGSDAAPLPCFLTGIDPETGEIVASHPVPTSASGVRGGFGSLWVADLTGKVLRIDPVTGETIASIEAGADPRFTAIGADSVWVMNQGDGTVTRVDPETDEGESIAASAGPINGGDIAATDDVVWVRTSRELAVAIDPATGAVVRKLMPPDGSGSVAITADSVWLTAHDSNSIYIVER